MKNSIFTEENMLGIDTPTKRNNLIIIVIFTIVMMILSSCNTVSAQNVDTVRHNSIEITKDGNFIAKPAKPAKSIKSNPWNNDIPTGKTYTDSKGNVYPVYIHTITRGDRKGVKVYVVYITPKSGKTYRKEIAEV